LKMIGANRMVIGHTTQKRGITSACNQQVWRIDVGLSAAYGSKPVQILEIRRDEIRILSDPR